MYSILRINDRYEVQCAAVGTPLCSRFTATVDTGARITCLGAANLGSEITEDMLIADKCPYRAVGGFVNGDDAEARVRIYSYTVNHFMIGTIDLGKQTVGVYFDKRVTDNVIGMDLLKRIYMQQYAEQPYLYLFDDPQDMLSYVKCETITCKETANLTENTGVVTVYNNAQHEYSLNCVKTDRDNKRYINICNLKCCLN